MLIITLQHVFTMRLWKRCCRILRNTTATRQVYILLEDKLRTRWTLPEKESQTFWEQIHRKLYLRVVELRVIIMPYTVRWGKSKKKTCHHNQGRTPGRFKC